MKRSSTGRARSSRAGARGTVPRTPRSEPFDDRRTIPTALGPELTAITGSEGVRNPTGGCLSDCEDVASYNLLKGLQTAIYVPGRPPMWTPFSSDTTLDPDSGEYYRDENAARFPENPMEPAVLSIFQLIPTIDTSHVDVFACASTLGELLRFTMGNPQPFTFIVHMIGKTAFFVRRNRSPSERIDNVRGFGHAFAQACTTWNKDVEGSASHQRIIRYTLGKLCIFMRFEADGYVLDQCDDGDPKGPVSNVDEPSSKTLESSQKGRPETIRQCGGQVPQTSILDIKTRSFLRERDEVIQAQLPRLWIRQIRNFALAFHTKGTFKAPNLQDITKISDEWEKKWGDAVAQLADLVERIRDVAMKTSGGKVEVRGGILGKLRVHELPIEERGKWSALSEGLSQRWVKE